MRNFELTVVNQTGFGIPLVFENGRELVAWLAGTEHHENVVGVKLECFADDGRRVSIFVPNDDSPLTSLAIYEDTNHPTPPGKAH